jgi:nucleoside-diphosphate-sugar epimerase
MHLPQSCTLPGSGEERGIRLIGLRRLHLIRALSPRRSVTFCSRNSPVSYPNVSPQGSLHLIHGEDVARSILATHQNFDKLAGQRWCLTDLRTYDWWDLVSSWTPSARDVAGDPRVWVKELMNERGVRALPRPMEQLGRALDSREFWEEAGITPRITLHSAVEDYLA